MLAIQFLRHYCFWLLQTSRMPLPPLWLRLRRTYCGQSLRMRGPLLWS